MTEIRNHLVSLTAIEEAVCDIAAQQLDFPRDQISPASRLLEDLHCDSLVIVELLIGLEDHFNVDIPMSVRDEQHPLCKAVFTRKNFRLADLAEAIYLQRGTNRNPKHRSGGVSRSSSSRINLPFSQLTGRWSARDDQPLFEVIKSATPYRQYRRRSDGMRCVLIPAAAVEIGTNDPAFDADSSPQHLVELDAILIDAETVSTSAYCRFLNSIGPVDRATLQEWFLLTDNDHRDEQAVVREAASGWEPVAGCEELPMVLVSWFGANAYSLWANHRDWQQYRGGGSTAESFLPTEAQWEYAARGAEFKLYPWGNAPPSADQVRCCHHEPGATYTAATMQMDAVHTAAGMSPFGLHHMAGNVWQWCRDWYDARFYLGPAAFERNPFNRRPTDIRSERGGSWVGPIELCRSSHRRGRPSIARGRCLGFRCVSSPPG